MGESGQKERPRLSEQPKIVSWSVFGLESEARWLPVLWRPIYHPILSGVSSALLKSEKMVAGSGLAVGSAAAPLGATASARATAPARRTVRMLWRSWRYSLKAGFHPYELQIFGH